MRRRLLLKHRGVGLCLLLLIVPWLRAEVLASKYNASAIATCAEIENDFAIIINTLPNKSYADEKLSAWVAGLLQHKPLVMDVNYNQQHNLLLELTLAHDCQTVVGEDMFVNQAVLQEVFWQK